MLFTSFTFLIFLPVVFILYWFVFNRRLRVQNLLLLIASYVFYGWWDWRFLSLIFISSSIDYIVGMKLFQATKDRERRLLLGISLVVNLGFLGVFKYYNFFLTSFVSLMTTLGVSLNFDTLKIILPVGISFYTFQTLSYTIDIYKGKLEPTNNAIAFFAFVSFFPQLVAGPIERATSLLPQFHRTRSFSYEKARNGMQQILWGFFKKIFVADMLANQVNDIFSNYTDLGGSTLVLGAIFFAFQIYGDFSGYSDIAIGTAKLFDFDLMTNFKTPYFAKNVSDFWRRWHISLSTWFRDYLYIPLGGSYASLAKTIRNIMITFTVSGLWHGANWTFVVWGFLNGLYILPSFFSGDRKTLPKQQHSLSANLKTGGRIIGTFTLITVAWVFFRADSIGNAFEYLNGIFSRSLFSVPDRVYMFYLLPVLVLLIIEWVTKEEKHPLSRISSFPTVYRWGIYLVLSLATIIFYYEEKNFIYFQF